ncbi:MAG: RNA methyltransferase substrate-binding domain-containing protein, partial [Syntrophomonadaceae bacterium]|nr:RNA methyltransferase substrate-binding domain-containing protein [Syntrophomonadaceae bacterium]
MTEDQRVQSEIRCGRRPVLEAIRAGRPINRIWVAREAREGSIVEIRQLARQAGIPVVELDRSRLDALTAGA